MREHPTGAGETGNVETETNGKNLAERRAVSELFEFRVPAEGKVLVTDIIYGDDENHRYAVTVEGGEAVEYTCKHFEYRNPGPEND